MTLSSKFKNNQELLITIAITFGIVALLNFFSYHFFWRADLTADHLYSTAEITKTTIKELPDLVTVRVYFSKNLPNQFALLKQQIADQLADYSVYGKNFHYQFIDPGEGEEAEKLGIPKLQFNDIKHDKLEVVAGYMGLSISYQDKQEIIPVVQDATTLEYELTSRLKKITASSQPTIGFLKSYSTVTLDKDLKVLRQELSKIYQIKEVDLDKPVPAEIKTLVILGVKADMPEAALKNLDKFLVSDHSLIVLQDGANTVTTPVNFNIENKSNLNTWLAAHGIIIAKNLIADTYSGIASFNQGVVTYNVNYPLWPKLLKDNFDKNDPTVAHLDSVILPWASSLEIDKSKLIAGAVATDLAKTSKQAWAVGPNTNINPAELMKPSGKQQQFTMAASISGAIKSSYDQAQSKQSQLIVVGDSDFIKDDFAKGSPSNLIFMQNLVDGATLDPGLASIRAKNVVARPIKNTTDQEKQWLNLVNIFGVTVLVIICGACRYYWRKRSKTMELHCYE